MIKLGPESLVAFIGSMNCMPMAYAYALKKRGYSCVYFVDSPQSNTLCRPECFYPELSYPYPDWVKEFIQRSQILVALFPRYFAYQYLKRIKKFFKRLPDCYVLNGYFVALGPYLPKGSKVVSLSHGSDLDVWANLAHAPRLYDSIRKRSIFPYLPSVLGLRVLKTVVRRQFKGFAQAHEVVYFPRGFSAMGDQVLDLLSKKSTKFVPRYDISFEVLEKPPVVKDIPGQPMRIFSGVRFAFKTFPDGDLGAAKGNDIIIAGLAKYFQRHNRNIQINFIEKGEDVAIAKSACSAAGLDPVVKWHQPMSFKELLGHYAGADVCFDQLGQHWIGQGMFSMGLGIPLIANASAPVRCGLWPANNPICNAVDSDQVCAWLVRLENKEFRDETGKRSREFARQYFDAESTLRRIFDLETGGKSRI